MTLKEVLMAEEGVSESVAERLIQKYEAEEALEHGEYAERMRASIEHAIEWLHKATAEICKLGVATPEDPQVDAKFSNWHLSEAMQILHNQVYAYLIAAISEMQVELYTVEVDAYDLKVNN
jgi:hypothetical protein